MTILNTQRPQWTTVKIPVECRVHETMKAFLFETIIGKFWMPKKLVRASKEAGMLSLSFPETFTINLDVSDGFDKKKIQQMKVADFVIQLNELFDPNKNKTQKDVTEEVLKNDEIIF